MHYNKEEARWLPNKCMKEDCPNPGLLLYGTLLVCGPCCVKLTEQKRKRDLEELENLK